MGLNGKDDNPENTKSVRERKQTAKGKQYQIQLFEDERSSAQRAWRSQLNRVESCLADSEDSMVLQNERMFLETKMELLVAAHEKLDFALEEDFDAKRVAQEKFETWECENYDVLKRLNLKITELRQEHRSLRSSKSGSSRSSDRSSHKTKSTRFSSSSSMGRKVDVAAQVAKLKTELMFVEAEAPKSERCLLCKNNHNLDECDRFALMSQTEKREYVKLRGICLGCLKFGHMKKDCRGRKTCKKCNRFHPSSLHIDHPVPSDQVAMQAVDPQAKPTEVTSNRVEVQDKKSLNVCSSHSLLVPV